MTYAEHYTYFDAEPYLTSPDLLGEALEGDGIAIVDLGPNLNAEALYELAESVGRVMLEPTPRVREQAYPIPYCLTWASLQILR